MEIIAHKKNIYKFLAIIAIVYVGISLYYMGESVFSLYPREYRDAANVQMTRMLLDGFNPYELGDERYPFIYVYTPLNAVVAAMIIKIFPMQIFTVHYMLDFIYILLTAGMIAFEIKKTTKNSAVAILGYAISLTVGWRLGYISAIPDHLGVLVCMGIYFLVNNCTVCKRMVFLLAVLSVLSFYVKQYFAIVCVPVFVYLLIIRWKYAIKYAIYCLLLGMGSLGIINYFCPLFTIETIFFMGIESSKVDTNGFSYSLYQMRVILKRYSILFLMAFYGYYLLLKKGIDFQEKIKFETNSLFQFMRQGALRNTIYLINIPLMLIVLLLIGKNDGAFLSYHLQLLLPSLVIISVNVFFYLCETVTWNSLKMVAVIFFTGGYVFWGLLKGFGVATINSEQENLAWEEAYQTIKSYQDSGREIYLQPHLSYYSITNNINTYDNGHGYLQLLARGAVNGNRINVERDRQVFPRLENFYDKAVYWNQTIIDKIKNREFLLITTDQVNKDQLYGIELDRYYICIKTLSLRTGLQIWETKFWVPRPK